MSEGTPNDPARRRMPWEPQTPEGGASEPPTTPPEGGWTPPRPTDPTTGWTPPQPATPPPPAAETPSDQVGLISSAPVGWTPPPAETVEVAPGLTVADTTSRAVAYIVDVIILSIIAGILGTILNPTTTPSTVTDLNALMATTDPLASILAVLVDLAYFVVAWTGGRRATIGQRLFNIQVGNAFDGRALSPAQAVRRALGLGGWIALLGIVPGIFLLSALIGLLWYLVLLITTATSPTKQGLHDRFANTALVRPSGQGTSGPATACVVILVVLLLLSVISVVALYFLGDQVSSILSEIGDSI